MFDGYKFYLFGNFGKPTIAELTKLLVTAGAEIIPDVTALGKHVKNSDKVYVLGDPMECFNLEKDQGVIEKFTFVQTEWVYCSISAFEPLDPRHFRFL